MVARFVEDVHQMVPPQPRVAFTVSKRRFKRAVDRNRVSSA